MDFQPIFAALDKAKAAAEVLGGEAKEAVTALYAAIQAQKDFVSQALRQAKPDQETLGKMLAPISEKMQQIGDIASKRKNDFPLHSKMINDAASSLAWVLENRPAAAVEGFLDAATFNGNKIMSQFKGDENHLSFVKETQNALRALIQQLKDNFPKGLSWGDGGASASATAGGADADGPVDTTGFDMTEALNLAEKVRAAGAAIGGEAKIVSAAFADGMKATREFVTAALGQNKPEDQAAIVALLAPVSAQMAIVSENEAKRKNDFPLHCKMMNDAAQAFSWVLDNKPAAIVEEYAGAAVFNGNKIMSQNKGDENHMSFVKDTQAALKALQAAVKQSFPKGLSWGANIGANANAGAGAGGDDLPTDTSDFGIDEVVSAVEKVKAAGEALGGEAKEVAHAFSAAIQAQKDFVSQALRQAKPDQETLGKMLAPISEKMQQIGDIASKRKNDFPLHSKMINDAASSLAWVLENRPAATIEEFINAAAFNGNKIMSQFKGQAEHMAFAQQTTASLKALHDAVKSSFPKGLTWGSSSSSSSSSTGGAAVASTTTSSSSPTSPPKVAAVYNPMLAELAKATVGGTGHQLKHVDDSQKLHKQKNREVKTIDMDALRAKKNRKNISLPQRGEEKLVLQGSVWQVNNMWSSAEDPLADAEPRVIELNDVQRNQLVCITGCVNCVVKIAGKINTVSILHCVSAVIVIQDTIGPVSVANSTKVKVIVSGNCPSVQFDKTDSSSIQLESQINTQIVTGMCSSINVVLPWTDPELPEGENKTVKEVPIHEQFQSQITGNKVKTTPTDIAG
jgi:hypothetical protein